MIDLTGANLIGYLLRQITDIVARSPRFRKTLGNVTFTNNQMVQWGNVQAIIKDVTAAGTRLSPDYFMFTQHGRVTVAKLGDKEGSFIEWPMEYDKTQTNPPPGVYNLNVDATSEKDQSVDLTMQLFKWTRGKVTNAQGSVVYFNPLLRTDGSLALPLGADPAQALDLTTLTATEIETGNEIPVTVFNSSLGGFMYLLNPCRTLVLTLPNGTTLNQYNGSYWYQRTTDAVICLSTLGGQELVNLPPNVSFSIENQFGFTLRPGVDYTNYQEDWIQLAKWTPAGNQLAAHLFQKLSPVGNVATNPENTIDPLFDPATDISAEIATFHTPAGTFVVTVPNDDGTFTVPTLLKPGQCMHWEAKVPSNPVTMRGKKYQMNGFVKTIANPTDPSPAARTVYTDVNGLTVDPLPGLWLAIGDSVVVDDQAALIVNPETTETYEVFGSKDNVTFTIETKANDLQTASDLAELVKQQLLIWRRMNMEKDGLTILESPRSMSAVQRDISGQNAEYTFSQPFVGLADWKVFMPLVTRVADFELTVASYVDYSGQVQLPPRMTALGAHMFVNFYA